MVNCFYCDKIIHKEVFMGLDKSFCNEKHRYLFINKKQKIKYCCIIFNFFN